MAAVTLTTKKDVVSAVKETLQGYYDNGVISREAFKDLAKVSAKDVALPVTSNDLRKATLSRVLSTLEEQPEASEHIDSVKKAIAECTAAPAPAPAAATAAPAPALSLAGLMGHLKQAAAQKAPTPPPQAEAPEPAAVAPPAAADAADDKEDELPEKRQRQEGAAAPVATNAFTAAAEPVAPVTSSAAVVAPVSASTDQPSTAVTAPSSHIVPPSAPALEDDDDDIYGSLTTSGGGQQQMQFEAPQAAAAGAPQVGSDWGQGASYGAAPMMNPSFGSIPLSREEFERQRLGLPADPAAAAAAAPAATAPAIDDGWGEAIQVAPTAAVSMPDMSVFQQQPQHQPVFGIDAFNPVSNDQQAAYQQYGQYNGEHRQPRQPRQEFGSDEEFHSNQQRNKFFKTRPCFTFDRTGSCPNGERCKYAHGPEELRGNVE